jgi:hypothetical protein
MKLHRNNSQELALSRNQVTIESVKITISSQPTGLDATHRCGLCERTGHVFFLDILSHRMREMGI